MSGRLSDSPSRFFLMSTSSPSCASLCPAVLFLWARQVLRCLFISEARMFWRQAWHCWRISRFLLGSVMMVSSMVRGTTGACWARLSNSEEGMYLLRSSSKAMVSTSSKSFQSMLLSLTFLASCSFRPRACCCLATWYSQAALHRLNTSSLLRMNRCSWPSQLQVISRTWVQAATICSKYQLCLEALLRNSNCGLFFYRSLRATRKFFPFCAAYWAVCMIIAWSPSPSFSGTSTVYFSGSGSFSSMNTPSRNAFCSGTTSATISSSLTASSLYYFITPYPLFPSSFLSSSPSAFCSSLLLFQATLWSQQARKGWSVLRKANSDLFCSRSIRIFSNSLPLMATCSAVFSSSFLISPGGMISPIITDLLQIPVHQRLGQSGSNYIGSRLTYRCGNNILMFRSFVARQLFARNKRMIAGNWKCNKTHQEAVDFVKGTINNLKYNHNNVDVIISPVSLHIPSILALNPGHQHHWRVAAQNASNYNFGAYTGEVSAKHLRDIGLEWVILGHSERRTILGEKDDLIVSKTKLAIENGLKVIYCFGETLEERKANKTWEVLDSQLTPLLKAFPGNSSQDWHSNIVLAYEPVWAIGTGISSTPEQTLEVFNWLRDRLKKDINESEKVRILYGGSANAKNAPDYLKIKSLDGLLIGGASLKPEFADMVKTGDEAI